MKYKVRNYVAHALVVYTILYMAYFMLVVTLHVLPVVKKINII